ncbi:hypothetical protein [Streptomyces finlayi]|uniref:hypothetical protein n=1 Tax=Streptomyces finlayi TaxID=67296 RepID=UPI001626F8CE|nr:hypothetical protein [Streptomyces finlayi]
MLPPSVVGDEAEHVDATNWPQILALCSLLEHLAPNPVVTLNRAAVAMVHGPAAGPDLPATLDSDWRTAHHHRLLAVPRRLLEQLGDHEAAAHAYREAARRTSSTSERRHLTSRTGPPHPGQGLISRGKAPTYYSCTTAVHVQLYPPVHFAGSGKITSTAAGLMN